MNWSLEKNIEYTVNMEQVSTNCKTTRSKFGRVLNVSWKVALVFVGIFAAFSIFEYVGLQCSEFFGRRSHDYDRPLSEKIAVHYCIGNRVRIYDIEAEKYVTPRLKWVADTPERDSLTVFCDKNDKRGFLNVNTGKVVIDAVFEHAWVFSEGLAAVVESDGKMGFIDHSGKYVIAPEFDYYVSHDYVFKHGVCCIQNCEGLQGLINCEGEWVLPQEYSWIDYVAEADMFIPRIDDKEGLLKNGSFEWVYPVEYDEISWTDAPTGEGFVLYKDYISKHVSIDGNVINPFMIDGIDVLKYMTKCRPGEYDEYEISDKVMAFCVYELWGVMDKRTGRVIIPAKYGRIEMASKDIIQCSIEKYGNDDYVLFDLHGNRI